MAQQALGFYRDTSSPTTTSIANLLDSAVNLLKHKITPKKAQVVKEYASGLQVNAVSGELRQVFVNLISNSLDALDEHGTIKLRISACSYLRDGEPCVRVTVADDGQGISPEAQQRVGEPFFTTKQNVGTGLGLWISKQIVAKHQGSFRIHSNTRGPRRGTTVSIVLPAKIAPVAARAQAAGL